MYHVSAQGVDERMINVHYYYYYCWYTRNSREYRIFSHVYATVSEDFKHKRPNAETPDFLVYLRLSH